MKKKIADKWIKALKSGKFKQCTGALQKVNGHCCLGVLTEICINEEGLNVFGSDGLTVDVYYSDSYNEGSLLLSGCLLAPNVQKWAGMKTLNGVFKNGDSLAGLNDKGKSFKQIANVIKKNWRKL